MQVTFAGENSKTIVNNKNSLNSGNCLKNFKPTSLLDEITLATIKAKLLALSDSVVLTRK